jgi:hypothetical protein
MPCSPHNRSKMRVMVWRCLHGASRSATRIWSIRGLKGSSLDARAGYGARCAGHADAKAACTVRQPTPCLRWSSLPDIPARASRRIAANSSTRVGWRETNDGYRPGVAKTNRAMKATLMKNAGFNESDSDQEGCKHPGLGFGLSGNAGDQLSASQPVTDPCADRAAGHHDSATRERTGGDDRVDEFSVGGHNHSFVRPRRVSVGRRSLHPPLGIGQHRFTQITREAGILGVVVGAQL